MRRKQPQERRCSYVVWLDRAIASPDELRDFSSYLSTVGLSDGDVVILDPSPRLQFEMQRQTLRWVGRHMSVPPQYRLAGGGVDLVRAAAELAACEKVIVATSDVRYSAVELEQLCQLLDTHEVVEPQDYVEPLPWWGGIDAARILVHRGVEPLPDHAATFAFRRTAVRALRGLELTDPNDDQVRRLVATGAEVFPASDVFVRREPPALEEWLTARPRYAGDDFAMPVKTAFFFALLPMLFLVTILGGLRLFGGYAGVVAVASVSLALRGRAGAASVFPLRACLFAPLWVFERSISVYWALFRKLRGVEEDPAHVFVAEGRSGAKVASGE
ncbi:MAG TPA: hypothetical protein VFN10_22020 [Thermoanaerobaculia bacterium]|nr:hypothetical protein [Thermoanaerobaculia bacterium]